MVKFDSALVDPDLTVLVTQMLHFALILTESSENSITVKYYPSNIAVLAIKAGEVAIALSSTLFSERSMFVYFV